MEHHFDIDVAKEYGIAEAVIVNNLQWWIRKNKANGTHLHDGRTWTYNSQKALTDLFPYLSRQSLRTAIKHLCEDGVIMIGDYNENPFNKVNWYAFVDEDRWIGGFQPEHRLGNTDGLVDSNQRVVEGIQSYTDNNSTDRNKTSNNPSLSKKEKKVLDLSFVGIEFSDMIDRWLKYKQEKRQSYTQTGVESLYRRLLMLSNGDARTADQIVEYSIAQNYAGLYVPDELKQSKQNNNGSSSSTAQQPRATNTFSQIAASIKAAGGIL